MHSAVKDVKEKQVHAADEVWALEAKSVRESQLKTEITTATLQTNIWCSLKESAQGAALYCRFIVK